MNPEVGPVRAGDGGYIRLDPRLEARGLWQDFHTRYVAALANHLSEALAPRYVAIVEDRVYVAWESQSQWLRPDVAVARASAPGPASEARHAGRRWAQPVIVPVAIGDQVTEHSVSIRASDGELVTTIELLSPNNKRPGHEGRQAYLTKRTRVLQAGIHLAELDFLLHGERMPLARPWPACDRAVLVVRAHRLDRGERYPFGADDPLPTIALPLREPDPDYPLDLQAILEETWQRARYDVWLRG